MPNPSTLPDFVDVSPFLNLGPDRWWEFKNQSSGETSRWACAASGPTRFQLRAILGSVTIEHLVEQRDIDVGGTAMTQYAILQSKIDTRVATWQGGLALPTPWKVRASVSAVSAEAVNPATGSPVELAVILARSGPYKMPKEAPYPPGTEFQSIFLTQIVRDTKLGTVLAKSDQTFAIGLGICYASGVNFGNAYVLELRAWSGAPPKP